jgi:signal transduction histidine kinase
MTLGELTASIAHEVNQPLAAIVTNGEACLRWLSRDGPQLDEVRGSVESMISDGVRASEVVRRLRALSQKADPQKVPLSLNDIINEVILLVQREVLDHRAVLRLELASTLPPVLGDRVQLQQVTINLLMNGMEAMASVMGRPRELVIRSGQDKPDWVLVAVQDSGVGIELENADRLFNAFFSTKPNGMGMGLSISRSIIEAHGGRMWAANNVGPGAIFQFMLPAHRETTS